MTETTKTLRKRLVYRAHHRGTKEMDLVLGGFADAHLGGFDAEDLKRFNAVLELDDADFLSWVTGQGPVPAEADSEMVRAIIAFARKGLGQ